MLYTNYELGPVVYDIFRLDLILVHILFDGLHVLTNFR